MCKGTMKTVLDKCSEDKEFVAKLSDNCPETLKAFNLTPEERCAIIEGDITWAEKHLNSLTDKEKTWFKCRLQQERW